MTKYKWYCTNASCDWEQIGNSTERKCPKCKCQDIRKQCIRCNRQFKKGELCGCKNSKFQQTSTQNELADLETGNLTPPTPTMVTPPQYTLPFTPIQQTVSQAVDDKYEKLETENKNLKIEVGKLKMKNEILQAEKETLMKRIRESDFIQSRKKRKTESSVSGLDYFSSIESIENGIENGRESKNIDLLIIKIISCRPFNHEDYTSVKKAAEKLCNFNNIKKKYFTKTWQKCWETVNINYHSS